MSEPTSVALTIPDDVRARVEQAALTVVDAAQALHIRNDTELAAASAFRKECVKQPLSDLDRDFKPIKQGLDRQKAQVIALHRKYAAPFERAGAIIDATIKQYDAECKRRQIEAANRIRQSLQDAAEQSAIERAAEMVSSDDEMEQMLGAHLLEDIAQGEVKPSTELPAMIPVKPKVAGLSLPTRKKFRIVNVDAIKREYMVPDEVAIQKVVTREGKRAEEIVQGIEYYEETGVASR